MGWDNPPVPWRELERRLSGEPPDEQATAHGGDEQATAHGGDGRVTPRGRDGYHRPGHLASVRGRDGLGGRSRVPYAELHCHSNFSFLDGASHPEELVEEAARLELDALAITDHDGM
jgi:error-prone DNA polymerase